MESVIQDYFRVSYHKSFFVYFPRYDSRIPKILYQLIILNVANLLNSHGEESPRLNLGISHKFRFVISCVDHK